MSATDAREAKLSIISVELVAELTGATATETVTALEGLARVGMVWRISNDTATHWAYVAGNADLVAPELYAAIKKEMKS